MTPPGFGKVLWMIFVIVLPFLGVFIYLIANHDGMTQRNIEPCSRTAGADGRLREIGRRQRRRSAEIEKAKGLLDSGAITQAEFDAIKQKALAAS